MILLVCLEMLSELVNAFREQSDLYLGISGVSCARAELFNNLLFLVFQQWHVVGVLPDMPAKPENVSPDVTHTYSQLFSETQRTLLHIAFSLKTASMRKRSE